MLLTKTQFFVRLPAYIQDALQGSKIGEESDCANGNNGDIKNQAGDQDQKTLNAGENADFCLKPH